MIRSEHINEIAAALSKAQAQFATIPRTKTVTISGTRANFSYRYADLAEVLSAVRPGLAANDLSITQTMEPLDKGYRMDTLLIHSSGQFLGSSVLLDRWGDPKAHGIEMTYMRRYQMCALLGVVSEDDTDAEGAGGSKDSGRKKTGKEGKDGKDPDEPEADDSGRLGLSPELLEKFLAEIAACETSQSALETYIAAYGQAKAANDVGAQERLLAAYRAHPAYVKPEAKTRGVT